ncbi:phytoene/squalene synthase family protein [Bradymonas sediminis]|uniref:Phytoene/squalene synthase family protein n=1 Tax=Bradymonas sediminis TaxID=1548548 RepID=A0A2Z4FHN5_9DELT|nr:phytoene/squalene synthase family protein [Bradymonas sediminis]AWV88399.1 phytoene/squalene synthase family protein [Bradymonas sediminis]TDP77526.1 phytoene synthase [Bradymonas sediminis]
MTNAQLDIPADEGRIPEMSAEEVARHSREVLAEHSRSFNWASRFLPEESRDDAAILYAFCRLVDDTVDEAESPEVATKQVEALRDELNRERAPSAAVAAFLDLSERRGVDVSAAMELVEGVASDLGDVLIEDDRALLRYCYRVAGTVGLMMSPVLGVEDPRAVAHAIDLGIGMQLTNICRDVLEDAQNGRVYLPETRLRRAGISQKELLESVATGGFELEETVAKVVSDLLKLADRYYDSADQGLAYIPARSRLGICVAARVYRGIGVRLRYLHDANPLHGRTVVPGLEKALWLGPAGRRFAMSSLLKPRPHKAHLHRALAGLPGVNAGPSPKPSPFGT